MKLLYLIILFLTQLSCGEPEVSMVVSKMFCYHTVNPKVIDDGVVHKSRIGGNAIVLSECLPDTCH